MLEQVITVWKDGTHKVWDVQNADYAQNDPDHLVNIPLPILDDRYPRRAHTVTINAGADTQEGLIEALRQILDALERGSRDGVSGSPSAGWWFTLLVDPEMTHDRYIALLNEAIASRQQAQEKAAS